MSPLTARKPEVMSPAGHWPELRAAVEAGADAVYFGLTHFTARAKVGFTEADLPEVLATLHRRGVNGYVTFNTLVFQEELAEAGRAIAAIAEAGADALIVQDFGAARLAQEIAPELPLHGSTQMTLTSAEGIRFAQQFGISRMILARELSLEEIRAIRAATDAELEIFVHGALCVSYSGQCFSSEAWGGRSANRGQCAQACRLPYELLVDDHVKPLGDARYLLSPGDLNTLPLVPELVATGLHALKIEGRYKDANYVALTTRAYRKAVDEAWAGRATPPSAAEQLELEQVYSRGSGPYFLSGTNHQTVVRGRSPRHRGVLVGRVVRVAGDAVIVDPAPAHEIHAIAPGDGVVFDAADRRSPEEREEGGRIYDALPAERGRLEIRFANGAIRFARVAAGDLMWRSADPETSRVARPFTHASTPLRTQPVNVHVTARPGEALRSRWVVVAHPECAAVIHSRAPLESATSHPLTEERAREQLGRLGNSAYELAEFTLDVSGNPFVPMSLLNEMRRDAVQELERIQSAPPPRTIRDADESIRRVQPAPRPAPMGNASRATLLHLLVRTPEQLDAAIALRPASVTLDYLELYGLRPSVQRVLAAGLEARVAGPRVLKPSEERVVTFLRKLECGILVRSLGLLQTLREGAHPPMTGDFSLNAANAIAADAFLAQGLERITPTHDLNAAQITALAQHVGGERLEVVSYHHLPVFHTEHCVFCRFLSKGTSYKDCGRPCETHKIALRDVQGRAHPVMADVGCRNTVFGAEAQEGSRRLDAWRAAGIRHFRLEFAHETAEEVARITDAFSETLRGTRSTADLTRALRGLAPAGTTEGSLVVA